MKYEDAKKLKQGDKAVERCLGYIMTVQSLEEEEENYGWTKRKYIIINCIAENGYKMRPRHISVNLYK